MINELPTDVTSDSGVLTAETIDRFMGEVFDGRTQQPPSQPPSPGSLPLQRLRAFAESMLPGPGEDLSREAIVREALINGTAVVRSGWNRLPGEPPQRSTGGGLRSWIVDEVDPVYEDVTVPRETARSTYMSSIIQRTERQRERDERQAAEQRAAHERRRQAEQARAMNSFFHTADSFWIGERNSPQRQSRLTGPELYEEVMNEKPNSEKKRQLESSFQILKPYLAAIKAANKPKSRNQFTKEQAKRIQKKPRT